jgi:hypothetical protein
MYQIASINIMISFEPISHLIPSSCEDVSPVSVYQVNWTIHHKKPNTHCATDFVNVQYDRRQDNGEALPLSDTAGRQTRLFHRKHGRKRAPFFSRWQVLAHGH